MMPHPRNKSEFNKWSLYRWNTDLGRWELWNHQSEMWCVSQWYALPNSMPHRDMPLEQFVSYSTTWAEPCS